MPDRIFLMYLGVAVGVLVLGVVALGILPVKGEKLAHAWKACLGWSVMIPVVFGALYFGRVGAVVLFTTLGVVGFLELAACAGVAGNYGMVGVVVLGIGVMGVASMAGEVFFVVPVGVMGGIMLVPVARNQTAGALREVGVGLVGFVWLGWLLGFGGLIAGEREGVHLVLWLMFAVSVNDVACYVVGKALGRHALRSAVSPGKTWEGAAGGVVVSLGVALGLNFLEGVFSTGEILAAGALVGVGGTLGDLMVSAVKRELGIKDFSGLIPGHGGVLDRVDSLLLTAPAFWVLIRYHGGSV